MAELNSILNQPQSLFCLCARKLVFLLQHCENAQANELQQLCSQLPSRVLKQLVALRDDILHLQSTFPQGVGGRVAERCYLLNADTRQLDQNASVLAMERSLDPVDFFDLCARYALDEPTARVYELMNPKEQEELLDRGAITWCRALELSPRLAILHYDDVALYCAANGFLQAMERSLMKVRSNDGSLLPKCVMEAIKSGHYAVANHFECDNYHEAFYCSFPDGNVPAPLFATLLNSQQIRAGVQIAAELLDWMPELSIQRLRRMLEGDEKILRSTLTRFDSMYGEMREGRDYPNDID